MSPLGLFNIGPRRRQPCLPAVNHLDSSSRQFPHRIRCVKLVPSGISALRFYCSSVAYGSAKKTAPPMKPDPIIHIENLKVCYGSFVAVDGLNLELFPGELFGLLGPNGAGKSTTLRVLIGQRQPTAGRVRVAGYDVVRQWALVKPIFGYVPDRENH